jgi:hypothetical protein
MKTLLSLIYIMVVGGIVGWGVGYHQASMYWKLTEVSPHDEIVIYTYGPYFAVAHAPGIRLEKR